MLDQVRARLEAACDRSGRDPAEVELVAVSKGRSALEIHRHLLDAGQTLLGESRVQEWRDKAEAIGPSARWHLIGHLQTNKVRFCRGFELLHGIDSLRLIEALEAEGAKDGHVFPVLLQLNLSGESSKHGIKAHELPELARIVDGCGHVRLEGLMTMAPFHPDAEHARPVFRELRRLADRYAHGRTSMGMSQDYEVAVEEGARWLRVGSALFPDLVTSNDIPVAVKDPGTEVNA